ncbi:reverse gyrase [Fervidobacterium thailandense]|uniref:Reverse gyrase n=1 Tax=Fervidobacterium thailandense TaxID=1008305 RepID=A0A1E3G2T2_9BACT|nr:reverse gyrase [Fervidobacterium thailandense]ODN30173.1 reverse gyrase [Fervidobacterium thailandense]
MRALYLGLCPNCGGTISDERLSFGNPCEKCLPETVENAPVERIAELLEETGKLKSWARLVEMEKKCREAEEKFLQATGFPVWSAQRSWIKRVLKNQSFSIVAPTGMGKSVFGTFMSLMMAMEGKRAYIVVPTTTLVVQTHRRLLTYAERLGVDVPVVAYHSSMGSREKSEALEKIANGSCSVLITSTQFLAKNFELVSNQKFHFVFVDDVDAFLKASKNVDRALFLIGFPQELLETAWELVNFRIQMGRYLLENTGDKRATSENLEKIEEITKHIEFLEEKIENFKKENETGILVVASATAKAKGNRVKLLRELLGFEIGSGRSMLRNVVDTYVPVAEDVLEQVFSIVNVLGKGGLIFVPVDQGVEMAQKVATYLCQKGVQAGVVVHSEKKDIDKFERGEIDVLIGVATYYGLLVRGIDLPHVVRYVVFAGVPRFKFSLEPERPDVVKLLGLLEDLLDIVDPSEVKKVERYIEFLKGLLNRQTLQVKESRELKKLEEIAQFIIGTLRRPEVIDKLEGSRFVAIEHVNGKLHVKIPDVRTYIQATGRVSRLFVGGVTKGISVILADDEKLLNGLVRQMRWYYPEFQTLPFASLDVEKLMEEIDRDRKRVRDIMEGKLTESTRDLVKSSLFIVESPNKARTIANFFGQPTRRKVGNLLTYEVTAGDKVITIVATGGHVVDLVTSDGYHGVLVEKKNGVLRFYPVYDTIKRCKACGHQFVDTQEQPPTCPRCGSENLINSSNTLETLKELAMEVDEVLIGTDPDIEGEKIAWDVANALKPYAKVIKRTEFHEVTRQAIVKAISEAREIDLPKVEAQLVRRIEDRWIGFELSQRLWKVFKNNKLSTGRVQTPVLGWIIERYNSFLNEKVSTLVVNLENGVKLSTLLDSTREPKLVEGKVTVVSVKLEEKELSPPPPYITATLLKDASQLGFSAEYAMSLAQDLFETGLITYIRTDSVHVSNVGIEVAKEYLSEKLGAEYFSPRKWAGEGTHECIRPTRPIDRKKLQQLLETKTLVTSQKLSPDHLRLYEMIFNRFIASQMRSIRVLYQQANLRTEDVSFQYDGYVEVFEHGWDLMISLNVPKATRLTEGTELKIISTKYWVTPKFQLFSQGDVVELMKERKIGRPSTYSKIVKVLLDRLYVTETRKRGKLIPTELGIKVYDYVSKKFAQLVSEDRTRQLEAEMDQVEKGADYQAILGEVFVELKNILGIREHRETV